MVVPWEGFMRFFLALLSTSLHLALKTGLLQVGYHSLNHQSAALALAVSLHTLTQDHKLSVVTLQLYLMCLSLQKLLCSGPLLVSFAENFLT